MVRCSHPGGEGKERKKEAEIGVGGSANILGTRDSGGANRRPQEELAKPANMEGTCETKYQLVCMRGLTFRSEHAV